jgi:hypothetical protein
MTVCLILRRYTRRYGITLEALKAPGNERAPAWARQDAALALREELGLPIEKICDILNRQHSVIYRGMRIARLRASRPPHNARRLTSQEIEIAAEMRSARKSIRSIAAALCCTVAALQRDYRNATGEALQPARSNLGKFGYRDRDLATCPIGQLPKDHPMYALDQEMARGREMAKRVAYEGGWRQSSIAACVEVDG